MFLGFGGFCKKCIKVDAEGRATGSYVPIALSGAVRFASKADNSLCRLATEQGLLKSVWSAQN